MSENESLQQHYKIIRQSLIKKKSNRTSSGDTSVESLRIPIQTESKEINDLMIRFINN